MVSTHLSFARLAGSFADASGELDFNVVDVQKKGVYVLHLGTLQTVRVERGVMEVSSPDPLPRLCPGQADGGRGDYAGL